MPRPGTKTGTPSPPQTIGPSRSAGGDAARLELQLQAARRPARAGLEAIAAARARAARGAPQPRRRCRPRSTRSTAKRATPGRRSRARPGGSGRSHRAGALCARRQRHAIAGGRDSCAARRRRPASAACPRRAPRRMQPLDQRRRRRLARARARSQRSKRLAPSRASSRRRHAARSRPRVVGDRREVGRGDLVDARPRRPATRSAARGERHLGVGERRDERRPDAQPQAVAREAVVVVAVVVDPAQAVPARVGLDRLARNVEPGPRPGDAVAPRELAASPRARRRRRRAAPAAGRSRPGRADGGRAGRGRRRCASAISRKRAIARAARPRLDALAAPRPRVEPARRRARPASRAAPSAGRALGAVREPGVGVRAQAVVNVQREHRDAERRGRGERRVQQRGRVAPAAVGDGDDARARARRASARGGVAEAAVGLQPVVAALHQLLHRQVAHLAQARRSARA